MAPRRSSKKLLPEPVNCKYDNLSVTDVVCPICRSILIEPVSLPCNHSFCSNCFHETIANVNLVCPLCRIRVGSWLRKASKNHTLVNNELWSNIRKQFEQQVNNKLAGIDEELESPGPAPHTAAPGEIRREYELQKAKEQLEVEKQHHAENKASEEYIRKLKQDEEYEQTIQEENTRLSEHVAKQLAHELLIIDPGPSTSKFNGTRPTRGKKCQGPLDKLLKNMADESDTKMETKTFTCKIMCQGDVSNSRKVPFKKAGEKTRKLAVLSVASDSNDSIGGECTYFKPIQHKYRYNAIAKQVPIVKTTCTSRLPTRVNIEPPSGKSHFVHSKKSAFVQVKVSIVQDCTNHTDLKRKLTETSNSSPSKRPCVKNSVSSPPFNGFNLNGFAKVDKNAQEAEDRKFARKLHEELNGCRYSTRSANHSRQTTLRELVAQKTTQVP